MTRHCRRPLLAILVFVGFTAFLAAAAQAQMACGMRDPIIEKLGEIYGEVRRGSGLAEPMAIFEVWASEATGSWTILSTTADGLTCVVAVGEGWQDDADQIAPIAGKGA